MGKNKEARPDMSMKGQSRATSHGIQKLPKWPIRLKKPQEVRTKKS